MKQNEPSITPGNSTHHKLKTLRQELRMRSPGSQRLRTYNTAELVSLFGVAPSEIASMGRTGPFRRLGADRYLLDFTQAALLVNGQEQALAGLAVRGLRTLEERDRDDIAPGRKQKVREFIDEHPSLLDNSVNVLNVPDLQYATLAAGMFVEQGLRNDERVAILSFEHPDKLLSRLAEAGIVLDDALDSEQLIYYYYKPDVTHSISLSVDYRELFGEVVRLGGERVQRLALFNVDALINANSEHLVHTSLHQLIYAANHYQITLLGLFVASGHVAELIDEGCRALLPGYFVLE